jgi:hypothetical protein
MVLVWFRIAAAPAWVLHARGQNIRPGTPRIVAGRLNRQVAGPEGAQVAAALRRDQAAGSITAGAERHTWTTARAAAPAPAQRR